MVATQALDQIKTAQSQPAAPVTTGSSIDEGLFVVGATGEIHYCDPQLEHLVGVKPSDVVGQSYDALFREIAAISNNEKTTSQELSSAITNLTEQRTVNLQTRDPLDCRLQIRFFPIHNLEDGELKPMGWGGIVLDTTAHWGDVAQWTEHLSVMTHSLRSSVATLKGFITTLLSSHRYWGENERQDFLENIDENVDQLSRLLENAQELFKLEIDAVELSRRPTDIKRLLQRVTQSLALQKSGRQFHIEAADDLPSVEVDALRIEQVLHNLLANAIQNTPRDKRIRLSARLKGSDVLIELSDNGTSVTVEELTEIFEGRSQMQLRGTDPMRGVGIGLYVARGLVLAHGGTIWAEPVESMGTVIRFTLPREATAPQASTKGVAGPTRKTQTGTQAPPSPGLELRPNREVAKVLVVDDDAQMLRLLKIKLEVEGFEVVTATRGSIALELAVVEQPDVILLDVKMPDLSGFEICSRMREFTSVPIIMVTGQSKEEDMVRGLDVGADDYLVKPIRNKELLARVRANLRRARVPEQTPSKPMFRMKDLVIDFAQRQVTVRGIQVRLTPTEYKLLYHLAANAGRILTHSQLLSKVWGPGYEEDTQYLWVNISRLRGKLEVDPSKPEYILTEPGVGYFLPDNPKQS